MSWKEFLKPNKWKLILFLISLLIVLNFRLFASLQCNSGGCEYTIFTVFIILSLFLESLLTDFLYNFDISLIFLTLMSLILVFTSYLISCLVVETYKEIKNKRKIDKRILIDFLFILLLLSPLALIELNNQKVISSYKPKDNSREDFTSLFKPLELIAHKYNESLKILELTIHNTGGDTINISASNVLMILENKRNRLCEEDNLNSNTFKCINGCSEEINPNEVIKIKIKIINCGNLKEGENYNYQLKFKKIAKIVGSFRA